MVIHKQCQIYVIITNGQQNNRRRRDKLRYTNTTKDNYGTNQNKRQKPFHAINQLTNKEEYSSPNIEKYSVKLEHDNLIKQLE